MDNLNRLVEALKKKALQAGKAGVNFVNKAPAAVGKYGSEKIIQPKIPQYKLAYNNFVKPAVKSTYEASKPIINYLDPRGYSKDDSKKLGGAMRAAPSTAFNAYGLTQLAKQPAFSVANYGIGGAFNVLAGDKKKPLAQRFTEGGRQGMEIAPKLAAIGSFSNPLIARGVNKASSLLSNPIAKQVVGRTATGIANIPEGMLMKKGITNAPYTPSDAAFDFGMGAVGGVPNGKVRVKGVTNNIKGIHPEDMKEISEIYKRMKVNYTFKGAANSLKGAIDLKAKDASLINNLYKQHIFNGAGVDKISFEDKVQQLFDQAAYDFRNRTPAFGLMAGNQAKGYNQAPNKFSSLADKKPRFEIDDSVAKLTKAAANRDYYYPTIQKGVLSEYLDHPKLYKEYPELQNAKVSFIKTSDVMGDGSRAAYDPKSNRITVNTDWINKAKNDDVKSTLLHEIQHAIQEKEGFARGGNIQPLTKEPTQKQISGYLKSKYNELIKKGVPEDEAAMTIQDDIEPYVERNMMHDNYLRLSGEIEARDVQSRMNLSPDKRLHTQPYASQGIPLKDQIVRFDGGTAASKGFSKAEDIKAFKTHILTDANLQRNLQELTKDGITPDANGLVTLYRGHSKKGDGVFRAFSYFTTNPKLAQRFGRNVETVLVNPKDLVITNRMGEGITFQNPVNLVKGNDGIHRIEPSNVMASIDNPQLRTSVPKGSYTNDPMIDNPLLSPRPKTDIKNQIKDLRVQARKSIEEQRMEKNVLKQELERFTTQDLQDFAAVRKMANSKAGQEGDIETLYKKNPKLMTKALERIREVYKNVEYDQEAFEKLMSLPKKSDTYVVKPNEYTKIQELKERLKTATDMVYHAEPKPKTVDPEATFNKELSEWSDMVLRDTRKSEQLQTKNIIKSIGSGIESSTDKRLKERFVTSQTGSIIKTKNGTPLDRVVVENAKGWKDTPRILQARETMERNFEDIMGKAAPEMKQKYLEPVKKAEAERVRWLNKERKSIESLGIKAHTEESSLLQQFGEGKIGYEELKKQLKGDMKKVNQIRDAERTMRGKYNRYLDDINVALKRNGYDPIPRRKDYFLHFQEVTSVLEQIGIPQRDNNLPTDINGLTMDFKPGKNFFSSALPRLGDKTDFDAITGIDRYIEGASKQIYHTDNIQRLRLLEKGIRETFAGTQHLTNFVANLGEYTNTLAGKKAMLDRAAESVLGRGIYGAADKLRKQTSANMVGANVSSALTNFIPLTQSLATTDKKSFVKGMFHSMQNVFKDDGFSDRSDFLTRRRGSDRLSMNAWESAGNKASWLFKTVDKFVSETIVRSKFDESIKKGMSPEAAMKKADDWAARIMADRSLGSMPTLFNSKTLGVLTQFQLEVNNQVSFMMKDIPRNFDKKGAASALAQVFIYSYIFNTLFQKATGRRPAFDPIGVAQQTIEDYSDPDMKKGQATKNLIGNVSNQLPFASAITGGRLPIGAGLPDVMGLATGDKELLDEITKPALFLAGPFGGGQIKKTVEGIKSYQKGYSESASGRVRFSIPQNPVNAVKTGLFGQWSTPEAQEYLRKGQAPLGETQSEQIKSSTDKVGTFSYLKEQRELGKSEDGIYDRLKTSLEDPSTDLSMLSSADPKTAANAIYRHVMNQPDEERQQAYANVKEMISEDVRKELMSIYELEQAGFTRVDRDLMLVPEPQRARAIYDRIMKLSKENRGEKFEQLKQAGLITPEVEQMIIDMVKKN